MNKFKQLIATFVCTTTMALTANATVHTTDAFPPMLKPTAKVQAPAKHRAPLNQERAKGLKVFGATSIDYDKVRHFANWYENEGYLDKLSWISKEDEKGVSLVPDIHMINAGAYNPDDGYYYAYKVEYYTIGITYSCQWLKVNPADGEWQVVTPLANDMHNYDPLYDMAYSVYDGEMFGLVQNSDGQVKSRIAHLSLDDSSMSDYTQLDDYYFAIAFDYDGNLFGIRWEYDSEGMLTGTRLDEFDSDFKVKKSTPILVNGSAFLSYYQHGLDFDYSTGDLLWAATDTEGNQRMIRINPDTYETEDMGNVGINEVMIGLYVPFTTATNRKAPARVQNLTTVSNTTGDNTVSLRWTNPTTTWNRKALDNLTYVYVYRDGLTGEPIAKLDASGKEGDRMSFTDPSTTKGVHTYYVRAVNANGLGVYDSVEGFAGHDVPGKVTNLQAVTIDNGLGVKISWDLPEIGDNDGWYDKSSLKYTITRMPGNKVVAKDITSMTYEDKNIEEAQYYTYTVVPTSADGEGTPNTSEGVLAGASLLVPFTTTFDTSDEANRFQSLNKFGINNLFSYEFNVDKGDGSKVLRYGYTSNNDIMLCSPAFKVEKGKKYRVSWSYMLCNTSHISVEETNHFRIMGGQGIDYDKLTDVIKDMPNLVSKRYKGYTESAYFTAPVDGDYSIAFQILTPDNMNGGWIYITGFSIVESPDNDLEVADFKSPKYVSKNTDNYFDVTVYNNGSNAQSNYTVEVGVRALNGTYIPFASTSDVPAIAAHASAVVRVKGYADCNNVEDIQAHVVLDGDGYAGNDFSDLVEVEFFNGDAFNYVATDTETLWTTTSYPMQFYSTYSGTQSIYPISLFNLDENAKNITGLAWEYNSQMDIDDINLKIYLSETTKSSFADNTKNAIGNQTLVYDGPAEVTEGEHWLKVNFPDNAFAISGDKNLIVSVVCEETAANGNFPVLFNIFNSMDANADECDGLRHSVRYNSNSPFDFATSRVYPDYEMPVVHLATSNTTGISSVKAGNLNISVFGRKATVMGGDSTLSLYDMSGRCVLNLDVDNGESIQLPVTAGVYMLRAVDKQGKATVSKVIIR